MMPFSVTKNSKPLGFLSRKEREALYSCKYGWIMLGEDGVWRDQDEEPNKLGCVYRGLEKPVNVWCNVYQARAQDHIIMRKHGSRESADLDADLSRVGVLRIEVKDGRVTLHVEDQE
jgi:hypothetical protein